MIDFPKVKTRLMTRLIGEMRARMLLEEPLLRQIRIQRQHEGFVGNITRADGSRDTISLDEHSAMFTLSRDEMRSLNPKAISEKLNTVAQAFARAQVRMLINHVSDAADAVGNTVEARGDITGESILKVLEKIHIDFDPLTEAPILPTLVLGLNSKDALVPPGEDFDQRFQEIIAAKKEEWHARENSRKLVD